MRVKPGELRPKSSEIPSIIRGAKKKIQTMYTTGKSFQTLVTFPSFLAAFRGTFLITGIGYQMIIPETLNQKWQSATWRASSLLDTNEAMIPVKVVPIFAPNVNGSICSSWITFIPTRGVNADVVMDELWTRRVIPVPMTIARYPLIFVALYRIRREVPRSIFWRILTNATKQVHNIKRARKKQTPPETLSSCSVAFFWKKTGQSLVSLSHLIRPGIQFL